MTPFRINDGSNRSPRLAIYGNSWGLSELPQRPSSETWSFEQVLAKLVEAGFDGMQAGAGEAKLIHKHGLRYCCSARINAPHETDDIFHEATDHGADCLTLYVGWGMESDEEMDHLADEIIGASLQYQLPTFFETHRATMLQDIYRTLRLLERWPKLFINADLSHYYCGQEMTYRGFDVTCHYLTPIWPRVGFIHGRIANGETMQIDVGDGKANPHARNFVWMWEQAMHAWLEKARPGDLFPFTPELGPPSSGYSLTYPGPNGELIELSDRWGQTLVLRDLAREAFAAAGGQSRPVR